MALNFQEKDGASRTGIILSAMMLLSIFFMVCYTHEGDNGVLHRIQNSSTMISSPLSYVGSVAASSAQNLSVAVQDATTDDSSLSALQEQNEQLRNMVCQLEEYRQEAQRLEKLLGMKDKYSVEGYVAHVVGRSSESYNQTITLDLGSVDGIECGQVVMGPNGVIGQTVSVSAGSSVVRLLSDPSSGCAVVVQSNRADGIVRGSLSGLLYLKNVDSAVQVQVGDVLISSGLGGSFLSGLMIGTVVSVSSAEGAERVIVVRPNETSIPSEVIVIKSATAPSNQSSDSSQAKNTSGQSNSSENGNNSAGSAG